jgi:hypothetical protein
MPNQAIGYMNHQHLVPEFGQHEPNDQQLESSVRHCTLFFLFSGAWIMLSVVRESSLVNWEHIFVGFLLFIFSSVLWLLHAFLVRGSPMAMIVASFVVRIIHKLFLAGFRI